MKKYIETWQEGNSYQKYSIPKDNTFSNHCFFQSLYNVFENSQKDPISQSFQVFFSFFIKGAVNIEATLPNFVLVLGTDS